MGELIPVDFKLAQAQRRALKALDASPIGIAPAKPLRSPHDDGVSPAAFFGWPAGIDDLVF